MSLNHLQPSLEFFTEVILQLKKKKEEEEVSSKHPQSANQ